MGNISLIRAAIALTRPLATSVGLLAAICASGYVFSLDMLYRPISDGPASHPMTILVTLCLAFAILGGRDNRYRHRSILLALTASVICLTRLWPGRTATDLFARITPFHTITAHELSLGLRNSMGVNTAGMFLLIALSIVLYRRQLIVGAQIAAFVSMAVPMVSITGYAYALPKFYGQMSMMTIVFGLPLGIAAACLSANRAILKAILCPFITGRIARMQIVLGYVFPFSAGFMIIKAVHDNSQTDLFGIFVVAISWFIILLVSISSVVHERIDHVRRRQERIMVRNATQDPLTGLANRRQFDLCFETELQRHRRSGRPLSLIMLDIDHFKRVNDTGGHPTGDLVLKTTATTIRSHTRTTDTVGRFGGEEFAVLLPDTSLDGARYVAETLRRTIESLHFDPWPGHDGKITASLGCAGLLEGESEADLVHRADLALYAAKSQGRNRVCDNDPARI